jgi:c-di-GMP-binding flagellar brake protein YcgR
MAIERRRHTRIDSINLLSYSCFDEDERMVGQGMGRTLNVSESGILLETASAVEVHTMVAVTIAFNEDLVDIKGKVIRCLQSKNGMFESGIEFFEVGKEEMLVLKEYIKAFLLYCKTD